MLTQTKQLFLEQANEDFYSCLIPEILLMLLRVKLDIISEIHSCHLLLTWIKTQKLSH